MEYEEIRHDSPEGEAAHRFLERVDDSLKNLLEELHHSQIIGARQTFRVTFGFSCGFEGQIAFLVENTGDCGPSSTMIEERGDPRLN
jgi:hypothetical protein